MGGGRCACSSPGVYRKGPGGWNLLHEYAGWYAVRGFAALVLDSLTPRGVPHVCTGGAPYPTIRALDVYRAVEHLGRQGVADPTRAVVQGFRVEAFLAEAVGRPR